ncbi:hypothetical protein BJV78DRAFT_955616 [Lactifluus subvellereus]|nr:hypothetical protein BJV78DRAFT_955616 [Lactifluus subvellereus]
MFNVSHPVFFAVIWWVKISTAVHLVIMITFMPILSSESPYYTPLTSIVGFLRNKEKMAEEVVQKIRSKIDGRILEWTFDTLVEDDELEKFFEIIPGFLHSDVVGDPEHLAILGSWKFSSALIQLLFVLFGPIRFPNRTKCNGVSGWDDPLFGSSRIILHFIEAADSLKGRDKNGHRDTNLCAQTPVAQIIADVQGGDGRGSRSLRTN